MKTIELEMQRVEHVVFVKSIYHIKSVSVLFSHDIRLRRNTNILERRDVLSPLTIND